MNGVLRRLFSKWTAVLLAGLLVAGIGAGLWWRWDGADYELAPWLEPNNGPDWWDDAMAIPITRWTERLRFRRLERRLARYLEKLNLPGSKWKYIFHREENPQHIEGKGILTFIDDRTLVFSPPIEVADSLRIPAEVTFERFGFGRILFRFEDVEYVGHFLVDPDGVEDDVVTFENDGLRILAIRLGERSAD